MRDEFSKSAYTDAFVFMRASYSSVPFEKMPSTSSASVSMSKKNASNAAETLASMPLTSI